MYVVEGACCSHPRSLHTACCHCWVPTQWTRRRSSRWQRSLQTSSHRPSAWTRSRLASSPPSLRTLYAACSLQLSYHPATSLGITSAHHWDTLRQIVAPDSGLYKHYFLSFHFILIILFIFTFSCWIFKFYFKYSFIFQLFHCNFAYSNISNIDILHHGLQITTKILSLASTIFLGYKN